MSVGTKKSPISLLAGEALEAHRLVRLHDSTEGTVVYADAGERAIGVTLNYAASGAKVAIALLHGGECLKVVASGTPAANATLYTANDGKVATAVSGEPIGKNLHVVATSGDYTVLLPYGMAGGDTDKDWVEFEDEFGYYVDSDFWLLDANDGGAATEQDAHAGVLVLDASDTTVADNDETYLISDNEIYKPAIGTVNGEVLAIVKARIKFTEANTDDANVIFGLLGGDSDDVANTLGDNGAGPADANQYIAMWKVDGGTVFQGGVRDTAQDHDTNVGAVASGSWTELKMVISDADITDGELNVEFFVGGVSGGTKTYAVSGATEMRVIFGVKNGGANEESLHIDRFFLTFKR